MNDIMLCSEAHSFLHGLVVKPCPQYFLAICWKHCLDDKFHHFNGNVLVEYWAGFISNGVFIRSQSIIL